jgi:high-affinity K+ transport system ATPase subunit B
MDMVFAAVTDHVSLVIPLAIGLVCYQQAERKGRNAWVWGAVGFLVPLLGLIAVLVLKPTPEAEAG